MLSSDGVITARLMTLVDFYVLTSLRKSIEIPAAQTHKVHFSEWLSAAMAEQLNHLRTMPLFMRFRGRNARRHNKFRSEEPQLKHNKIIYFPRKVVLFCCFLQANGHNTKLCKKLKRSRKPAFLAGGGWVNNCCDFGKVSGGQREPEIPQNWPTSFFIIFMCGRKSFDCDS